MMILFPYALCTFTNFYHVLLSITVLSHGLIFFFRYIIFCLVTYHNLFDEKYAETAIACALVWDVLRENIRNIK